MTYELTNTLSSGVSQGESETSKSYNVTQYNLAVQRYLKDKVPQVWVHGVITQLNIRGKIVYITLGHFDEGDHKPLATLQVFMWTGMFESYNLRFSNLPIPFELKAELKVCMMLEADFYVPFGKFQPRVLQVDENFTLGELAQTRAKIIDKLKSEGLLDKNRQITMSPVPLKIGLITAPGSAAFKDFTTILLNSSFSFQIFFHPAKMQGEATENTVIKAINFLSALELDAICLVRGGGAKTDLIYFDSENICRAIANCPIPVLTGIGHEIDTSIADMVSHDNRITPTDCAKYLQSILQDALYRLEEGRERLTEGWYTAVQDTEGRLRDRAGSLEYAWASRQGREKQSLAFIARQLSGLSLKSLDGQKQRLIRSYTGIKRGPVKLLDIAYITFNSAFKLLSTIWSQKHQQSLQALAFKNKLIHAADPQRYLERGMAFIKDENGNLITSVKGAQPGTLLTAEVLDGYITGKITSTKAK